MGADYNLAPKATGYGYVRLVQAAPVLDTWYEVAHLYNVKIWDIQVQVNTVGEDLEVRFNPIDGQNHDSPPQACVADTPMRVRWRLTPNLVNILEIANFTDTFGALVEARDIVIEIRKSTANGAGDLTGTVKYGQY